MSVKILAVAAAFVLALSGCADSAESAAPAPESTPSSKASTLKATPKPTPEPTPTEVAPPSDGGSYSSLAELQQAYIEAGGDCISLNQTNAVTLAAESGDCDANSVIATYLSPADISELIQNNKAMNEEIGYDSDAVWLTGKNWTINSDDAAVVQQKMGGQLVSF